MKKTIQFFLLLSFVLTSTNTAFSQALILDDGTTDNLIGDAGQFIWMNRFTPPPADFPLKIDEVSVVFGSTLVTIGDPIEIFIWEDTDNDGDPGTGANLVYNFNSTVQFNDGATFSVYALPGAPIHNGPGDLIIGVVNRAGSEGFNDFPAALDQTASQGRSWAATYLVGDVPANPTLPADEQWGTIDSFGFPGNWMIRASYTPMAGVPTIGQWGLIILSLLILTFGVVALRSRQTVLAGTANTSFPATFRQLPFNKTAFGNMLIYVMIGLAVTFAVAVSLFGYEMTSADVPGSLVAGPLLAYLLHLLVKKD